MDSFLGIHYSMFGHYRRDMLSIECLFSDVAHLLMHNQSKQRQTAVSLRTQTEESVGQSGRTTRSTINTEMRRWHGHRATSPLPLPLRHLRVFLHWHPHKGLCEGFHLCPFFFPLRDV